MKIRQEGEGERGARGKGDDKRGDESDERKSRQ